ncbi:MAG: UDP-N-acetylmuramoyl-tripeptide--D-alanyl-D-alanine ligase [Lentisphaeria bacterium]|nr:UDP-N-acetylmuramoyl-tripeptide--D-alanyl-D-alanine ligase [Lentisphaeria bacterium]
MSASFSPQELSGITGGSWFNDLVPPGNLVISTDTRCENRGKIFFALAGERFDAHNFLTQAVDSGCDAICVNREKSALIPPEIPALLVDNTLIAMQKCAAFHRRRFPGLTVFGVTGSVGKTSVKEMLRSICSHAAGADKVLATIGNTNNQVGVVQNILRLTGEHRFAVLEAGTSSPGEIAPLARMIQPDGAIVNSIAPCHLENLLSLEGVAAEKGTMFHHLADNGAAVFPAETAGKEILQNSAADHRRFTFGMDGNGDVSARFISGELSGSTFELTFPDGKCFQISWHLTGKHNALNAAGAAALAFACNIPPEVIAQALPATELPGMRMKKTIIDQVTYFNDAYNANPASMHASVELLASATFPGRLILLLGGMRELGELSLSSHQKLLDEIALKLPDAKVIAIGAEFAGLTPCHFNSAADAGTYLQTQLLPGDTVFAKGSRGNCVENALPPEAR